MIKIKNISLWKELRVRDLDLKNISYLNFSTTAPTWSLEVLSV